MGHEMEERIYFISEAAKQLGLQPHVLRYWQGELKLKIHRNEMGYRYYNDTDLAVLRKVALLKREGLQLRAIKTMIDGLYQEEEGKDAFYCKARRLQALLRRS